VQKHVPLRTTELMADGSVAHIAKALDTTGLTSAPLRYGNIWLVFGTGFTACPTAPIWAHEIYVRVARPFRFTIGPVRAGSISSKIRHLLSVGIVAKTLGVLSDRLGVHASQNGYTETEKS
jgi:hypothetical protein